MNPSISLPASIAVGTIAVPASPTSQPLNLVVTSVAVPTTTTITGSQATSQPTPLLVRPPVTQILQQTLEKRQAQNRQQQSGTSQGTCQNVFFYIYNKDTFLRPQIISDISGPTKALFVSVDE